MIFNSEKPIYNSHVKKLYINIVERRITFLEQKLYFYREIIFFIRNICSLDWNTFGQFCRDFLTITLTRRAA